MACLLGLAALTSPVAARYLPTKRGSQDGDRLDRLAHLIKELLAESDAAPMDHTAYDQRVFYKREAPSYPERDAAAAPLQVPDTGRAQLVAPAARN
ncbi:Proctolin [Frankliniella occidentalis]|nr:Proctolin [Frankliniella occidentalis]